MKTAFIVLSCIILPLIPRMVDVVEMYFAKEAE